MKTQIVTCGECGRKYRKKCHDLDLKIGDRVMHKSWAEVDYMKDCIITITDVKHKKDGLYFGWIRDVVWPDRIIEDYRVDTRDDEFVKVP